MPTNKDYLSRLSSLECHDSTYMPSQDPLVFSRANGSLIWDVEGKEFIDLCAGFGALALGHASDALRDVAQQFSHENPPIEHGMGDVYPAEEKVLFLETLRAMLPPAYATGALALGGGQAVEIAMKTAMLSTGKTGFIVFEEGYHGLDLGVLPLTARSDFRAPFKEWLSEDRVIRVPYGCSTQQIEEAIKQLAPYGLSAIVVEPLQGRAGVKLPPEGWLSTLALAAHAEGGLLIFDEIFTGFGRLGQITAAETVDADLLCFGKAIGGGFPVSACFAKNQVMDAWPKSTGEAIHTGTFFGHPFSLAVGRRTLTEINRLNLCHRARELGEKAKHRLVDKIGSSSKVKDIRGQALMMGIEFHEPGFGAKMMDRLRKVGVIALPSGRDGNVLSLSPALNIPENVLFEAIDRLAQCL